MATWTNLSFPFGSTLTSTQMTNLDNNLDALAEGAAGAPAIQLAAMDTNSVDTGQLVNDSVTNAKIDAGAVDTTELATGAVWRVKIQTSTITLAGSLTPSAYLGITLNAYAFFPMIHGESAIDLRPHRTDGASPDNPRFGLVNGDNTFSRTYDVDYRYINS